MDNDHTDPGTPVCVAVSALDAGHITLPERLFVTDADSRHRVTVLSLSFLIQHQSLSPVNGKNETTRIVFDLGVKRELNGYREKQLAHVADRQPVITNPDCAASLRNGSSDGKALNATASQPLLDPGQDIDFVILSHVHWDHIGTPSDFANATFIVGSGTMDLLKNGAGPLYPADLFNDDELPRLRTAELPPVDGTDSRDYGGLANSPKHTNTPAHSEANLPQSAKQWAWKPLAGFPNALDFFSDRCLFIIDSPGHLYGHVNVLARLSKNEYVYLGGDCCHDPRILSGEKDIAMYEDGMGGFRSVHKPNSFPEPAYPTKVKFESKQQDVILTSKHGSIHWPRGDGISNGPEPPRRFELIICDTNSEALERFKEETTGKAAVKVVDNGFEAAKAANILITMLPGSSAVKSVYLDPKTGIVAGAVAAVEKSGSSPERKLIIECGTIETDCIHSVASFCQEVSTAKLSDSLVFVDAPVSGGPMGAVAGTLTFMVGCPQSLSHEVFPIVKSYLEHMGNPTGIFMCGDVGAGTAFKIINNYLSAITSLAASEALNIGVKAGLDPKTLTDVINVSGGQCWVTSKSNPVPGVQEGVPSSRNYEGGFRIELCAKVLSMRSKLAESVGAKTVLDKPTLQAFSEAMGDERYSGKDARVVYKWLKESK